MDQVPSASSEQPVCMESSPVDACSKKTEDHLDGKDNSLIEGMYLSANMEIELIGENTAKISKEDCGDAELVQNGADANLLGDIPTSHIQSGPAHYQGQDLHNLFKLMQGLQKLVAECKDAIVNNNQLQMCKDLLKRMVHAVAAHVIHLAGQTKVYVPSVTIQELEAFAQMSLWNKSAVRVFADNFVVFHGINKTHTALQSVIDHFHIHIKGLKAKRQKQSKPATVQKLCSIWTLPQTAYSVALLTAIQKFAWDKQGAWPYLWNSQAEYSPSIAFVPGLPINTYRSERLSISSCNQESNIQLSILLGKTCMPGIAQGLGSALSVCSLTSPLA
ncbi:hypothetical protein SERLADRAFT_404746 [Serpula lacrymans var. lacrymans S7.9]|uniref:Uncharacterized protein n=1 Tax=Serpula lacrymans var. lacrymans (strain S7.9) TaxID=578457 RepID=F8NEP8_SERL9|nr:uncharacterized protein SERLADRAFT_404746 [Serpula lacrymans var. lacrymans S7.9]EGO30682.1 hypothetical protein SERLADRAFT_404746 [Serpula lacrymans var. lacrymans S7.9]